MQRQKSFIRHVRGTSRAFVLVVVAVVLSTVGLTSYMLTVTHRASAEYTQVARLLRVNHEAMLDQETGLRAWLATEQEQFLEPYHAGRRDMAHTGTQLQEHLRPDSHLSVKLVALRHAQDAWVRDWGEPALSWSAEHPGTTVDADLAQFLAQGKSGFDAYRGAYTEAIDEAVASRDAAMARAESGLAALVVVQVVLGLASLVVVLVRGRQLRAVMVNPLVRLQESVERVRHGESPGSLTPGAAVELTAVHDAVVELAGSLHRERERVAAEHAQTQRITEELRAVLTAGQSMAACTTEKALAVAVVSAAAAMTATDAALWVCGPGGVLRRAHRSTARLPGSEQPAAGVRDVVESGRVVVEGGVALYPLSSGGHVVAVLELEHPAGVRPTRDAPAVAALCTSAAAHLRSVQAQARLREQASTDELTGLGNRHRMRSDLAAEWSRAERHERPLALAMLDLDRFKEVNDTGGHQVGDAWLRLVGEVVTATLATHGRAYRYGGEEIAILLPGTSEADAVRVLERIRVAIAATQGPAPAPHLTASIGVAVRRPEMFAVDHLVASADRALYEAKRAGRNIVVPAAAVAVPQHLPLGVPAPR